MPSSASRLLLHLVLAVLDTESALSPQECRRMNAFLLRHFRLTHSRCLAAIAQPDHIHLLVEAGMNVSVQKVARKTKAATARWLNRRRGPGRPFHWQRDYLAFTVAPPAIERARRHILSQQAWHATRSFHEECEWMTGCRTEEAGWALRFY